MTARFVNWSMATPNSGEAGRPGVCPVFMGFENELTMEYATPPIVEAVREAAGEEPDKRARLISETVLEPKLATIAAPVASLMATPTGLVPTVTAATGWVF